MYNVYTKLTKSSVPLIHEGVHALTLGPKVHGDTSLFELRVQLCVRIPRHLLSLDQHLARQRERVRQWCESCVDERVRAWEDVRKKWWVDFGKTFRDGRVAATAS